jgi:hypothetical protein
VAGLYAFQNLLAHLIVSHDLTFGCNDLKTMLGDVVRALLDVGDDFVPLNARSHVPIGAENNVLDLSLKNRRLVTVGFSNDDVLVEGNGAIRGSPPADDTREDSPPQGAARRNAEASAIVRELA